jgi:FkbM family methyltransferase
MKAIKDWLKMRLGNALGTPAIQEQLRNIPRQELFGLSYWYEGNLWEPPVQIALRDLCKPGKIVFDVGANFGGLTTVMSRMVGPRGVVCAFEASPRIIDKCQRNIVLNGCNNVQIYNLAVYHNSTSKVPIYLGSHLNDSIYTNNNTESPAYYVSTIAIDDFVESTNLVPDVVKMDIEGAEFDAVKGMLKTISTAKPHLILETSPSDSRCLISLREKGYIAIDLNTYKEVRGSNDYPDGVGVRNNLYIHTDRLSEVIYKPPFQFMEVAKLTADDFVRENSSLKLKKMLSLSKGRYLIDVDFTASGTDNEMMCGVKVGEKIIFRYHSYTKFLANSYRDWVINLNEAAEVSVYFDFINGTDDPSFSLKNVKIVRVQDFDRLTPLLFD